MEPVQDSAIEGVHLRQLLADVPSTIYVLGIEGDELAVLWASENLGRVLGYSVAQARDPGFFAERLHPDDRGRILEGGTRLRRDGEAVVEYRFRAHDGEYRWIRDVQRLLYDAGEKPRQIVGSWSDITESVRAGEALRESEERFGRVFENAPIGMAVVGLDERFLQVNSALCAILGRGRDELLRMTVPEVTHPDDVAAEMAEKDEISRSNTRSFRMEKRYVRPDGGVVWGQLSVSAIDDAEGRPAFFVGQLEDITDRKRAEEALRDSEERFRALTEHATGIVAVFDRDSIVRFATPSVATAFGRPLEEIVGASTFDFVHPDDVPSARRAFGDMLANPGGSVIMTLRVLRRDGSARTLEAIGQSLFHIPAVGGLVVHARDVTEQRRLEEQIAATQKLESVGRLAGGVAHDFNNLLTAILGYVGRLETTERGPEDARFVDGIRRAAERAGKLTHQLLAFARKQVMTPRALDLNTLVRDSEDMLRRLLGEDLEVSVELARNLPPVKADPSQVEQILLNLAANARDAMPGGGRMRIATAAVDIDAREARELADALPGSFVVLEVSDTGAGMPSEILDHIFEPFYTTKKEGQGTGLGLATVYGIAKQSGGWITVRSAPGLGSTFRVFLPRAESAPEPAPATKRRRAGGGETILLVEDDATVRELARLGLEMSGFRILEAISGDEALRLIDGLGSSPDLLITDVVMPGMQGTTLADRVRALYPAARVLFISGYAESTVAPDGGLPRNTGFLAKPFEWKDLVAKAREILDA